MKTKGKSINILAILTIVAVCPAVSPIVKPAAVYCISPRVQPFKAADGQDPRPSFADVACAGQKVGENES